MEISVVTVLAIRRRSRILAYVVGPGLRYPVCPVIQTETPLS